MGLDRTERILQDRTDRNRSRGLGQSSDLELLHNVSVDQGRWVDREGINDVAPKRKHCVNSEAGQLCCSGTEPLCSSGADQLCCSGTEPLCQPVADQPLYVDLEGKHIADL